MRKIIWKKLWARKYAPFMSEAFMRVFQTRSGFDMCANKLFLPEGNLYAIYFAQREFDALVKNYSEFLFKQNLKKCAEQYEAHFKGLLKWARRFARADFRKLSGAALAEKIKECAEKVAESGEAQFLSFVVLEGPGRELEKVLSAQKDGKRILRWISAPDKLTLINKARLDLLKMAGSGKTAHEDAEKYLKKFSWIPVYEFIDKPWTVGDILAQLKLASDSGGEIKRAADERMADLADYRRYIKSIGDQKLKKTAEIVHAFAYLKEMRDDYRRRAYCLLRPFWQEVARRAGLSFEETNYLLADELARAVRAPRSFFRQRARARMKKYSLVLKNGKLKIFARDVSRQYLGGSAGARWSGGDIVGTPAGRGVARGRASVIFHQGEFKKFKKGNVLVTVMTHPEFLPLMKQASAIVTDEGGITCHAAIVARELGIPCVIGVKIATKVFKDGDLVEVDADKGIVKKL